jgi:uncharacterized protein DUF4178
MSFTNPTPLRLGMAGTIDGKQYRVAGRVVMGMEEDGEIYYWNEFNMVSDAGDSVTLVFEETDRGGEWRLFTLFEPEYPISAQDAASKRRGDPLNLDGTDVRVTLVDESRVYRIEGEAPEGVEVGDVSKYFNAEAGNTMQVVSWSGEEVECYNGTNLRPGMVAAAFNLPPEKFRSTPTTDSANLFSIGQGGSGSGAFKGVIAFLMVAVIGVCVLANFRNLFNRRSPVTKTSAAPSPLVLGNTGALNGTTYRVRAHALVEMAEVGRMFNRHEYFLDDGSGNVALLICGSASDVRAWSLFAPMRPLVPLTPQQAGAVRWGETVNVEGIVTPADELFRSTIEAAENPDLPAWNRGATFLGFSSRSGPILLFVRWNEREIQFYRGETLAENMVLTAFKTPGASR